MSVIPAPLKVFSSSADVDGLLRHELQKHLSLLKHEALIVTWQKCQAIADTDWTEALDRHFDRVLISCCSSVRTLWYLSSGARPTRCARFLLIGKRHRLGNSGVWQAKTKAYYVLHEIIGSILMKVLG